MTQAYFDHANAAPLLPEAREAMLPFLTEGFGSPVSLHHYGEKPRQAIEDARASVAKLINARPDDIVFTSSGSESNNQAIKGFALARLREGRGQSPAPGAPQSGAVPGHAEDFGHVPRRSHIVVSAIEHVSVLEPAKSLKKLGFEVTEVPVDPQGKVAPDKFAAAIRPDTILAAVMHANYEVGTIQNVKELARIAHEHKVPFHSDGAAAVGRISVDVQDLAVDSYAFPAAAVYGPKGAAALYLKRNTRIQSLIEGGVQERNRRAGTENVAAIAGFGVAAEVTLRHLPEWSATMKRLAGRIRTELPAKLDRLVFTGSQENRAPGHVSVCVEFVEGESMLLFLDDEGVACASGSSCTARTLKASHVLLAMGLPHSLAQTSLVLTLGKDSTDAHVDHFLSVLPPIITRLRAMSPLYAKFVKGEDPYAARPGESCEDEREHGAND
jgi:cysteine desulfurase